VMICECTVPLVHAIQNKYNLCAETLIKRGAIYNQRTIDYVLKSRNELYEKRRESLLNYIDYESMEYIYKIMNDNYSPTNEVLANDFIKSNTMTGDKPNYFIGLENV
jgi:hypothetical protein